MIKSTDTTPTADELVRVSWNELESHDRSREIKQLAGMNAVASALCDADPALTMDAFLYAFHGIA